MGIRYGTKVEKTPKEVMVRGRERPAHFQSKLLKPEEVSSMYKVFQRSLAHFNIYYLENYKHATGVSETSQVFQGMFKDVK